MPTSNEIRRQFIDYFKDRHRHSVVPSSSVVPYDDPTLLFANAGMNQFKDVFLATGSREYVRAVNSQKCIRAGGKHNDLEDVGKDTYHHTFFEMLGNWSFGDYFKAEAIEWAWDLFTNVWGLPKDRLYVTVFGGDEADGLPPDDESTDLWPKVTDIDPSHISRWGRKDNFWEMAETGPCGVNSELHIDLTPDGSGADLVNRDDPRVVELWNLVFIQYNRDATGNLTPLPAKHVDTGLGLERICAVIQGKGSNDYETDVFTPLFEAICQTTGARPYGSSLDDPIDMAYRVIADHIRCLTFALTDGAVPGNEGRGYVLRRILRRAVRHGWQTLNTKEPFVCRLVPTVVKTMGEAFPELTRNTQSVIDLIREEEESFDRTLDRGIALFETAAKQGGNRVSADDAFKLHDTYGFPLDLTQIMAEERGLTVDVEGFDKLMEQARDIARGAGTQGAGVQEQLVEIVQNKKLPNTEFLGYDHTECTVAVADRVFDLGAINALVTSKTPFYAEAGGQVGDIGSIQFGTGTMHVTDTQKVGDVYFHFGTIDGNLGDGEVELTFGVDRDRRVKIMANHTATHMMNRALRRHVSETADQKGSLVDDEKTRFDFSHNAALTTEQIEQVEEMVNADIAADLPVYYDYVPQEEALKINGLRAVFGERYPATVRVVSVGVPVADLMADPPNAEWADYSIEFCGGTHLAKTGDAEGLVIVSEEAVAKGIRRIVAITGRIAHRAAAEGEMLMGRLEGLKSAQPDALAQGLTQLTQAMESQTLPLLARTRLREDIAELQRKVKQHQKQQGKQAAGAVVEQARELADEAHGRIVVGSLQDADNATLRTAMDVIRKKKPDAAILLGAVIGKKVAFVAAVPQSLIDKGLKAGDWVREVAKVAGGGGGGRPDMAQAGGKDPAKMDEALRMAKDYADAKI